MRRDNKTRDVTRTPNWTQNERVDLGDSSERVQFNEGKQGRRSRSRQVSYSASTNALSAVSLLLLIGLIATVFFAFYNADRTDGKFQYFSPSEYLTKIGSQEIIVPAGDYFVDVVLKNPSGLVGGYYKGYVNLYGEMFESINQLGWYQELNDGQFEFDILGERVVSYFVTNSDGVRQRFITITQDHSVTINEMPQLTLILDAWSNVKDFPSFGSALAGTCQFVVDYLDYQANLLQNLLPWNSVVEGESNYLEGLWERGQS